MAKLRPAAILRISAFPGLPGLLRRRETLPLVRGMRAKANSYDSMSYFVQRSFCLDPVALAKQIRYCWTIEQRPRLSHEMRQQSRNCCFRKVFFSQLCHGVALGLQKEREMTKFFYIQNDFMDLQQNRNRRKVKGCSLSRKERRSAPAAASWWLTLRTKREREGVSPSA